MAKTTLDELFLMVVRNKATKKRSASSEDGSGKHKRSRITHREKVSTPSVYRSKALVTSAHREKVSTPSVYRSKALVTSAGKEKVRKSTQTGSSNTSYFRRCSDLPGAVRLWESPLNEELLMKWNQALDRYAEICTKFCKKQRDNAVRGDIE